MKPAAEVTFHKAIVTLLRRAAHRDIVWLHVPNGEKRSAVTGAKLKALGVRAGAADLAFVISSGRAAFLELKRPGGRQSPSQIEFANDCVRAGALYAVADNIDAAIATLSEWGVLKSASTPATAGREGRGASAIPRRRAPSNTTTASAVPRGCVPKPN